jgi:glycosidase
MIKKFFLLTAAVCLTHAVLSQPSPGTGREQIDGHPAWIIQGNIYEVNIRQYTPEGTFKAFAGSLDRLRAMGVQTLWFMPIHPISKKDRKGTLGSYYAVADYTAVNPEFGTLDDWISLVRTIHRKGMKVILDWVPNHTGADNRWLTAHPDFFVKDSTGQPAMAADWSDTRQLDYSNREMQDSMIAAMDFWLKRSGIDGFRCDVAWNVPGSFWSRCIAHLKKEKNIFMLAEGDKAYLPRSGFDAVYPWNMFNMMKKVAAGERPAFALDSAYRELDTLYPANTIELYFTSNHDENSWNKADFAVFPGPEHAAFAVFTQTMAKGVPLIYSGQEEPVLRPLAFFEKDPIHFRYYARADFYKILLNLRKRNPALAANAGFRKIAAGDERAVYAYVREKGNNRVLVILNFSGEEQPVAIRDRSLWGKSYNVFLHRAQTLNGSTWKMKPWGYEVYVYGAGSGR